MMSAGTSEITVVIVDDHPVVCDGIRRIIEPESGISVVGEAHSVAEALSVIRATDPDVVLLDFRLPDGDGTDVMHGIDELDLDAQTLVLTAHNEAHYLRRAMEAGAAGILTKASADRSTLTDAVRNCSRGVATVTQDALDALRGQSLSEESIGTLALTAREREVLRLVAEGKTNAEIAEELFISVRTVKYHVGNLLAKTGARTRAEAVSKAFRSGIADSDG